MCVCVPTDMSVAGVLKCVRIGVMLPETAVGWLRSFGRPQAWAAALVAIAMAACAHTAPSVALNCLPMRVWSEDEKASLKLFYDSLPPGSVGKLAVEDLTKLRAENRAACGR